VEETFRLLRLNSAEHPVSDTAFFRPSDVTRSVGDASKAHTKLQWKARHHFASIVKLPVEDATDQQPFIVGDKS
jgi:GDP-D-mannose dehydratase